MNEMIVFDKDEVLEMVAAHLIKKRLIKAGIHYNIGVSAMVEAGTLEVLIRDK